MTPADGFKGVMVVRYTVADKTEDLSRQAVGRVRMTVRDDPDAPSAPIGHRRPQPDGSAQVGAAVGQRSHRSPRYTVRSNNGFEQKCATTTCTLTGLTNNVKYVFTVTATNEVGDSQPSAQSNEIRPDEKPSPPEAPQRQGRRQEHGDQLAGRQDRGLGRQALQPGDLAAAGQRHRREERAWPG